jgi:putative ABC transport system permease protein
MNIKTTILTALRALYQNKVRSLLTVSGVVIGVFSVITLISLVKGVENFVLQEFETLGANTLFIYPGGGGLFDDPALGFQNNKLAKKHVEILKSRAGDVVDSVAPIYSTGASTNYRSRNFYASVMGSTAGAQDLFDVSIVEGRRINEEDVMLASSVAVIGSQVKEDLFGNTSPVGKQISVDGKSVTVVGYMPPKSPDHDPMVLLPIGRFEQIFDLKNYTYIAVRLRETENIFLDSKKVELALLSDLTRDDFTVYTSDDLMDTISNILNILRTGLVAIASISLLVGGVGIMNVMLVSVTERIREIGLRKALGARESDIVKQFLIEASLLSFFGGFLGLVFGIVVCLISQRWLPTEVSPQTMLLALSFSLLVGIVFGTFPAVQAAKLDAIDSLRHE